VAAYREVVSHNYQIATGKTLGPDEWPPGQAILPTQDYGDDELPTLSPVTCTLKGTYDRSWHANCVTRPLASGLA
jgi:hypothetical protein